MAKCATVHTSVRTSNKHAFGPVDLDHLSAAVGLGCLDD